MCMDNCDLEAQKPRRRCYWHQLLKDGTDVQAAEATNREREFDDRTAWGPEFALGYTLCGTCRWLVPPFYMKTKNRCKGCQILLDRDKRDAKTYGAGAGTRQKLHALQGGKCAGCRNIQKFTGLAIHHNHVTGEICALLCKRCNHDGLGALHDDPYILLRLLMVLTSPPARRILDVDRVLSQKEHAEVIINMMKEIWDVEAQELGARHGGDAVAT